MNQNNLTNSDQFQSISSTKKIQNILELKNITKKYPGVTALSDVTFEVRRGKILSLVGENGAGKSTLLKSITGVIPASEREGDLYFEGKKVRFNSIKDSESNGIAIIHQELSISPFLPVYENIFMGHFKRNKVGVLDWNWMIKESKKWLDCVGLTDIDVTKNAGFFSVAQQQLIEIAKVLSQEAKLIILDEPTASLNDRDSYLLLDIMKKLKNENNITSIFVSHKLKEVEYVADDIVVIRDGKFVSSYNNEKEKISEAKLIKDIVGRDLSAKFPKKPDRKIGKETLRAENVVVEHPQLKDVFVVKNGYFNVKAGEIVGLAGLVGSGRSELALSVFGRQSGKMTDGQIFLNGKKVILNSVSKAISNGVMYASEDRKGAGLIQMFSIDYNIASSSLSKFTKFGVLDNHMAYKNSVKMREKLGIKVPSVDYLVETLSGGNQQKVVLAKSLTTEPTTLIIDEPTKGIDVGSKYEIYNIIFQLASEGKAVIVISSELEELIGLTDRIFVMDSGYVKGEIPTSEATQEKIFEISQRKV
ncbi:monosaccharide ABC transporter ATP-binding protein (CUT2 family) [Mycoplasma testudineum]|uniref:Monosaccharide ABC transporter ATP-binding protein (CUT2 family) n=1 Tax=Mycoplasma testudineum TaxID=244584 RepID=A0A4R6IFR0_9MOLU|nr:sugar ABC transporter ATP-binding protein [Mycoplasma testudineum]OYD27055.1 ABC transporter ATP-binding protein [Mycoplasma testudineum]TDO21190.1 monosaccharide ABC transporter ATP-binding protein (CUT2 family) [Mycoplasma testudineum]